MRLKALSLFSGCGGLDWGFHSHGVEIVAAIDNDAAAIQCYNFNFKGGGLVIDVLSKEFNDLLSNVGPIDIVLGGFPCQGFSKSGPKRKEDPRNTLYLAMHSAIETLRPAVFVAENVDGLAQNYKGEMLETILRDFRALGYTVEYRIIDAADFGVPQHRRRIIFIGTKANKHISWPRPTNDAKVRNGEFHSKELLKHAYSLFDQDVLAPAFTIKDAIGDLENIGKEYPDHITLSNFKESEYKIMKHIKEGQKLCNVRFAESSVFTWDIPEVYGFVTSRQRKLLEAIAKNRRKKKYGNIPNGNPLPIDEIELLSGLTEIHLELEELVLKDYLKKMDDKYDLKGAMFVSGLYKRPRWDEPSPTILTIFYSPRYLLHPSLDRPLTIRECARLQSFPNNFEFIASGISIQDGYRLIGNAVPPRLASQIAKKAIEIFQR